MSELVAALERTRWEIADIEVLRYHYAHTLAEWYPRTCQHEAEITALYDARLFRMWQFYLAGAEQSFRPWQDGQFPYPEREAAQRRADDPRLHERRSRPPFRPRSSPGMASGAQSRRVAVAPPPPAC